MLALGTSVGLVGEVSGEGNKVAVWLDSWRDDPLNSAKVKTKRMLRGFMTAPLNILVNRAI